LRICDRLDIVSRYQLIPNILWLLLLWSIVRWQNIRCIILLLLIFLRRRCGKRRMRVGTEHRATVVCDKSVGWVSMVGPISWDGYGGYLLDVRRSRFQRWQQHRRKQRCGTKRNFHTETRRNEIQTYHRIGTPVWCSVLRFVRRVYYQNIVRARARGPGSLGPLEG